ncbi:MAG: hypothetical protein ACRBG0_19765 [Lewinella sp.]|uniref:hypothetical protein n=1 Tax=Lewinella sp. TaxID=2004506 RepID=UPI003D6A7BBA
MNNILLDISPEVNRLLDNITNEHSPQTTVKAVFGEDPVFGTILSFDGQDDYLQLPLLSGVKAISMWVKLNNAPTYNVQIPYTTHHRLIYAQGEATIPFQLRNGVAVNVARYCVNGVVVGGWDDFPQDTWFHLYVEATEAFDAIVHLMGKQGQASTPGRIARLRVYDRALSADEIEEMDSSGFSTNKRLQPFDLNFWNQKQDTQLYRSEDGSSTDMFVDIQNTTNSAILLTGSQLPPGPAHYHFSLEFESGLLNFEEGGIKVQQQEDWQIKSEESEDDRIFVWITYSNRTAPLTIAPNHNIELAIVGLVIADLPQNEGRNTSVKLRCDHLHYVEVPDFKIKQNQIKDFQITTIEGKQDNLLLALPFDQLVDGKVIDNSRTSPLISATEIHGATLQSDDTFGPILHFDGVDDYGLLPELQGIKSISVWVNFDKATADHHMHSLLRIATGHFHVGNPQIYNLAKMSVDGISIASWGSIPRDQWVHLYFEAADSFGGKLSLMSWDPSRYFSQGKLSRLRIFSTALAPQELDAQREADVSLLTPPQTMNRTPLRFSMKNLDHNTSLYLNEAGLTTQMVAEIRNTSTIPISLKGSLENPDPDNYHFALEFQPGQLDFTANGIQIQGDWSLSSELLANKTVIVWIVYNKEGDVLEIPASGSLKLNISGLAATDTPYFPPVAFPTDQIQYDLISSKNISEEMWDQEGLEIKHLNIGTNGLTNSIAISPDGRYILEARGHHLYLFDVDGRQLKLFPRTSAKIRSLAFSPDGKHVLAGTHQSRKPLTSWNLAGLETTDFQDINGYASGLVFSPDGQSLLVIGVNTNALRLLDLSGTELQNFQIPYQEGSVKAAAFTPDGQYVVASTSIGVRIWNLEGIEERRFNNTPAQSLAISPDGVYLLTSYGRSATLRNIADGQTVRLFALNHRNSRASFSPNGEKILIHSPDDNTASLWNLDGQELMRFSHSSAVKSAIFSPDGSQIITRDHVHGITIWNLEPRALKSLQIGGPDTKVKLYADQFRYTNTPYILQQTQSTRLKIVTLNAKREHLLHELKLNKLNGDNRLINSSNTLPVISPTEVYASLLEDSDFGPVLSFNGIDQYLQIPSVGAIKAISVWINLADASSDNSLPGILIDGDASFPIAIGTLNRLYIRRFFDGRLIHGQLWDTLSEDKWVHLYIEPVHAYNGPLTLMASATDGIPSNFLKGKLARLSLFSESLTDQQIKEQRSNDLSVLLSELPLEPLYMKLLNNENENILYVTDQNIAVSLQLVLSNYTSPAVVLEGGDATPGVNNYHFALEFEEELLDLTRGNIQIERGWSITTGGPTNGKVPVWILFKGQGQTYTIPAGGNEVKIELSNLFLANGFGQNELPSTSVELAYQQLAYQGKAYELFGEQAAALRIVNLKRKDVNLLLELQLDNLVNGKLIDTSGIQATPIKDTSEVVGADIVMDEEFGSALRFNGVDNFVRLHEVGEGKALSMWVNLANTQDTTPNRVLLASNFPGERQLLFRNNTNNLRELYVNGESVEITYQSIPENKWVHLYMKFRTPCGGPGSDLYVMANDALTGNTQGRLAHLRLFKDSLSAAAIEAEYLAGISIMNTYRALHPLDFSFLNDEDENTLYITENTGGKAMVAEIVNTTPTDIRIEGRAGTASKDNHHFMLEFRPGILLKPEKIKIDAVTIIATDGSRIITDHTDWNLDYTASPGKTLKIWLSYTNTGADNALSIPANDGFLHLKINGLFGDGKYGSRGSQVQLQYNELKYPTETNFLKRGAQIAYFNLVSHVGREYIPLHAGFIGSNTVINQKTKSNGDALDNDLTLRLTNTSKKYTIKWNSGGDTTDDDSLFIFDFVSRDDTDESVLVDSYTGMTMKARLVRADTGVVILATQDPSSEGYFDLHPETTAENGSWKLSPTNGQELGYGDYFEVKIAGIITDQPSGISNLYIRYEDIPGFWDGEFVLPIEKGPLVFRQDDTTKENRVGIGTDDPKAKLHVAGGIVIGSNYAGVETDPQAPLSIHGSDGKWQNPDSNLHITSDSILFGGNNNGHQLNSAQISVGRHFNDSLSIIGMGAIGEGAKIDMWHAGGLTLYGGVAIKNTVPNTPNNGLLIEGKVGIGTDDPGDYALNVNGEVKVNSLHITGDVKAEGRIKDQTGYLVPIGGIIMYSGSAGDFHSNGQGIENTDVQGWALCDGQDRRPDLRDKFIVGAGVGTEYSVGDEGGDKNVTLNKQQIPSHSHNASMSTSGGHKHVIPIDTGDGDGLGFNSRNAIKGKVSYFNNDDTSTGRTSAVVDKWAWTYRGGWDEKPSSVLNPKGEHSHAVTIGDSGGNEEHENRPPYYALIYIMKL